MPGCSSSYTKGDIVGRGVGVSVGARVGVSVGAGVSVGMDVFVGLGVGVSVEGSGVSVAVGGLDTNDEPQATNSDTISERTSSCNSRFEGFIA